MDLIRSNNGLEIEVIGSGTNTFGKEDRNYMGAINNDTTELASAITAGYRHFDTAISYRNEGVVGLAVKESGIDRDDFFLTSKIPGGPDYMGNEEAIIKAVESSLKALQTDYIDLYLVHHPWDSLEEMLAGWRVLEKYVDQGVLKAIGVSNFNEEQLAYFIEHARIKPAVNQIESHAGKWNHEIIAYSLENGIIPEAWGPLSRTTDEARAILTEIGKAYNKTWAQVVIRYQLDLGMITIPKSHNAERQKDNLAVFDFELTETDRKKIAAL